jgi:ribosomal protein L25 (general stress protein Ctc)
MSNKPEKIFQHGALKAAIFSNEREKDGQSFTVKRVSFHKLYRDREGALKTTTSLEINDLPKATLVLQKAYEYLTVRQEAEDAPTTS